MVARYAPLQEQLLDATQGGDLLRMHRLLLNNEADGLVNARLEDGARTALHVAVERGNEAAAALLLAHKADRLALDADGKTPVELAMERDAAGMLALLTQPAVTAARVRDVRALMQRTLNAEWKRNRRISPLGWIFIVLTCCLWAAIVFAAFVSLAPRTAQRLMGPRAHAALTAGLARFDAFLKEYEYKPDLKFDKDTPEFVKSIVRSSEKDRVARAAANFGARPRGHGEL